jgi:multiple antibiotic resistance protein
MLAGPASLSTVAALMGQAEAELWKRLAVYAAVAFVGALTWLTLLLASPLHRALGRTGIHVMSRVLGLILAAIAVQFVLNGLRDAGVLPALVKPAG